MISMLKKLFSDSSCPDLQDANMSSGARVAELMKQLPNKDDAARNAAIDALAQVGAEVVPALAKYIHKGNDGWYAAVQALGKMGQAAKDAVPQLVELLDEKRGDDAKAIAAWALGKIGPDAKSAMPALMKLLEQDKSQNGAVLSQVVFAIGAIGTGLLPQMLHVYDSHTKTNLEWLTRLKGKEALPILVTALEKGEHAEAALGLLGALGAQAAPAVPIIKDFIANENLRSSAVGALIKIGPAAVGAADSLIPLLGSRDFGEWTGAAYALREIGYAKWKEDLRKSRGVHRSSFSGSKTFKFQFFHFPDAISDWLKVHQGYVVTATSQNSGFTQVYYTAQAGSLIDDGSIIERHTGGSFLADDFSC